MSAFGGTTGSGAGSSSSSSAGSGAGIVAGAPQEISTAEKLIKFTGEITSFDILDWVDQYVEANPTLRENKQPEGRQPIIAKYSVFSGDPKIGSTYRHLPKIPFDSYPAILHQFLNDIQIGDTIGDGSCLIHAILTCFSHTYRSIPNELGTPTRRELMGMVDEFRHEKMYRFYQPAITRRLDRRMNNKDYIASRNFLEDTDIKMLSRVFHINVIVLAGNTVGDDMVPYYEFITGVTEDENEPPHYEWPTIVIYGDGESHWSGCKWGNQYIFKFNELPADLQAEFVRQTTIKKQRIEAATAIQSAHTTSFDFLIGTRIKLNSSFNLNGESYGKDAKENIFTIKSIRVSQITGLSKEIVLTRIHDINDNLIREVHDLNDRGQLNFIGTKFESGVLLDGGPHGYIQVMTKSQYTGRVQEQDAIIPLTDITFLNPKLEQFSDKQIRLIEQNKALLRLLLTGAIPTNDLPSNLLSEIKEPKISTEFLRTPSPRAAAQSLVFVPHRYPLLESVTVDVSNDLAYTLELNYKNDTTNRDVELLSVQSEVFKGAFLPGIRAQRISAYPHLTLSYPENPEMGMPLSASSASAPGGSSAAAPGGSSAAAPGGSSAAALGFSSAAAADAKYTRTQIEEILNEKTGAIILKKTYNVDTDEMVENLSKFDRKKQDKILNDFERFLGRLKAGESVLPYQIYEPLINKAIKFLPPEKIPELEKQISFLNTASEEARIYKDKENNPKSELDYIMAFYLTEMAIYNNTPTKAGGARRITRRKKQKKNRKTRVRKHYRS